MLGVLVGYVPEFVGSCRPVVCDELLPYGAVLDPSRQRELEAPDETALVPEEPELVWKMDVGAAEEDGGSYEDAGLVAPVEIEYLDVTKVGSVLDLVPSGGGPAGGP